MKFLLLLFVETIIISTLWYWYLHKKTKISKGFIFKDNVLVMMLVNVAIYFLLHSFLNMSRFVFLFFVPVLVLVFSFTLTMIRFWRTPKRNINAGSGELVSPADGNIVYIKKIEQQEIPISIKEGVQAKLEELTKTNILQAPCWLIGINMTPFDVHKNCAPIEGKIILNKHFDGQFLSLKDNNAITQNERNTLVLENNNEYYAIVQTASRLVRRIDSYVKEGETIDQGDWFGMIRFGSQVDLIIPASYTINVELKDQVYARTTIIAGR